MSTAQALQQSIKNEIEEAIQHRCDCEFYSSAIYSGEFSCQTTTSDVIYRAIINGTSDLLTASELLDYIEHWKKNDQTMLHNLFRLRLSQDCPIKISSFNEVECTGTDTGNNNTMKNSHNYGRNSDKGNLLLSSGTCYRFEACDSNSDGRSEYSGESGWSGDYSDGSGGNDNFESGSRDLEDSSAASGGNNSADDDYFGGITYS